MIHRQPQASTSFPSRVSAAGKRREFRLDRGSRSSIRATTAARRPIPSGKSPQRSRSRAMFAPAGRSRRNTARPFRHRPHAQARSRRGFSMGGAVAGRRRALGSARALERRGALCPRGRGPAGARAAGDAGALRLRSGLDRRLRSAHPGGSDRLPAPLPARAGRRRSEPRRPIRASILCLRCGSPPTSGSGPRRLRGASRGAAAPGA